MKFLNYKSKIVGANLIAGLVLMFIWAPPAFAVPSSTNYNLQNYNFGWGGVATSSSTTTTIPGTNTTTTTPGTNTTTNTTTIQTNTVYPSVSPTIIYVNNPGKNNNNKTPVTTFVTKPISGFIAWLTRLGPGNIFLGLLALLLIGLILGLCLGAYYGKRKKHHNIS